MKTCPECGTQYEDHVLTCLVDGVDLSSVPSTAPPPSVSQAGQTAMAPGPVVVTQTSGPSAGLAGGVLALAGISLVVALGVVALAIALWWFGRPVPEPAPAPAPPPEPIAIPEPPPTPVPPPEPEPVAAPVPTISLASTPAGASVWEGETQLCVTPCTTPHPPHAPLPREFVLKLDGYLDTSYEMSDPSKEHAVTMRRPQARPTQPKGPKAPVINMER